MPPTIAELIAQGQQHHVAMDLAAAENFYRQVLTQQPQHTQALYLMALVAEGRRDTAGAIAWLRDAIQSNPNEPNVRAKLAQVLSGSGRHEDALEAALSAVKLEPLALEPYLPLMLYYQAAGQFAAGRQAADEAARNHPTSPRVQWHRAIAALLDGDMEVGWPAFQNRLRAGLPLPNMTPPSDAEQWERQPLKGKMILLYCEGGFGDAIQFVRYVPQLSSLARRVLLTCPSELLRLFGQLNGVDQLLVRGARLPACDYVCPLQSLPFNFLTTLETIPRDVPYLRPEHARRHGVGRARERERSEGRPGVGGKRWLSRVALAKPHDARAPRRRNRGGLTFYSLQKGVESQQATAPPAGMNLVDLTAQVQDFADLAAMIEHLDLVISVDTSVAHLAGAMGKPTWTLIPFVPDFRWLLDRTDSPWYPTMRLFRQPQSRDWNTVAQAIAEALREFVDARSHDT